MMPTVGSFWRSRPAPVIASLHAGPEVLYLVPVGFSSVV